MIQPTLVEPAHGAAARPSFDAAPTRPRALRLAFAGGGTGGHVVPGLHLLEAARPTAAIESVLWFTSGRAVEERVLERLDARVQGLECERVVLDLEPEGGGAPSLARLARATPRNVARARRALEAQRCEVLLALGGFTALPAALAAKSLRIPVALLELNAARGRATRALAPFAQRVFYAWRASLPAGRETQRHRYTGPPLPPELVHGAFPLGGDPAARELFGFARERPLLLVLGGSQGAQSLNAFVARALDSLLASGVQVLHQTGPDRAGEGARERAGYRRVEYMTDVPLALRAATIALSRGGASTLAELAAAGVPALVVPYPHHPDRHQELNARELGPGARIVPERELGEATVRELAQLASASAASERAHRSAVLRRAVPTDASEHILRELERLVGGA